MWIAHNCWISFCHFLDIVNLVIFTRVSLCDCVLMPYDKVYSDGIRADPEASDMTTRSDGELHVVCPAQHIFVTMVISVIHLM